MTVALITTNPYAVIATFPGVPNPLPLPDGRRVSGADIGFTSGVYSLVSVTPFVPSAGQMSTGSPSYSIDGSGNVTETYDTTAIPAVTWIPAATFIARFTDAEYIAIRAAVQSQMQAGNATLAKWIDQATAEGGIDVSSDTVTAAKTALVAAGLLTSQRADAVFATM